MLTNIISNRLPWSYKIVIQSITYMTKSTFEDVMDKLFTEIHYMAIREQKLGQKLALSIYF